jgi:protoheme IX farnesyltransferase
MLYLILFFWQFPHFMAIAWMYRDDYARAGYLVLPRGEYSAQFMSWQAVVPSLALIPVSLIAGASPAYRVLACIASGVYVYYSGVVPWAETNS